jgi:hypothetical protein
MNRNRIETTCTVFHGGGTSLRNEGRDRSGNQALRGIQGHATPCRVFALALMAWASLAAFASAQPKESPEKAAAKLITPAAERAIERGLTFLARRQNAEGTFGSGNYRGNVGVVSLAAMALMAGGSTPTRGPQGPRVALALDYVLASEQGSGYIVSNLFPSDRPMYGHGFATLFMAECYGMSRRPEVREKLGRAVKLIIDTQNAAGGWRYFPQRTDADISVTVCQVMALRAARNAGIHVPRETIAAALAYIKKCQNPDGGFMYRLEDPGTSAFARSAAAVVGLYSLGDYEGPEVTKGINYMMTFLPEAGVVRQESYYFYGQYYAALAAWQARGTTWERWYPAVRYELIARQREDGSWMDQANPISAEYSAAMACLVLQVPNNYLPIFQR